MATDEALAAGSQATRVAHLMKRLRKRDHEGRYVFNLSSRHSPEGWQVFRGIAQEEEDEEKPKK